MGVLAPGSEHAWPSTQPPIDTSGNFSAHRPGGGVIFWKFFWSSFLTNQRIAFFFLLLLLSASLTFLPEGVIKKIRFGVTAIWGTWNCLNLFTPPPRHMCWKISAGVDGGLSGGSSLSRPRSEDPHRHQRKLLLYFCSIYLVYVFDILPLRETIKKNAKLRTLA